ncbi:MAG TPA: hypothetical protein VFZ47_04460 [Chitinophagaceae bacterium]
MALQQYSLDPRKEVQRFRNTYVNFYNLWKASGKVPDGIQLVSPSTFTMNEEVLPELLKDMLTELRKRYPMEAVRFLKYIRFENGDPVYVVEDENGLPEEDRILTLSRTATINTVEYVKVVTELFVAEKIK